MSKQADNTTTYNEAFSAKTAIGGRLGRNIVKVRFSHNCAMNQWAETSQHSCDQSKLKQENLLGPKKILATYLTIALTFRDPYQL